MVVNELLARFERVIVVDDGSRDDTGAVALAAGATVLTHPMNLGQGAALATGLTHGLRQGAEIFVTFDADGQHDPADIEMLLAALEGGHVDVALGSRFLGSAHGISAARRLLLKAAVAFTRVTTGLRLTDAHNGLRAFNRRAASAVRIQQNGMAHASEIIEQIARARLRWAEVPVTVRYTEYSRRKGQRWSNSFSIVLDLLVGRVIGR